jgi:tetratricopeptide (TPR) repeat protein
VRSIFFVLVLATAAHADAARDHFKQGTTYYALGKYPEAAVEYEHAYELHPDPALLYNAAQAHRMAGNKPRALLLYNNYLRLYGSAAKNRGEVQRFINQLKAAIDTEKAATTTPPTTPEPMQPQVKEVTLTQEPPVEKKRTRPWVWGVVGGAVAVAVGVGLGVGLGLGLSHTNYPQSSLMVIKWQ